MKVYVLEREQLIDLPRREVFAFFSDAFNLERITPRFLKFRILTERPVRMEPGTLLEYRLSLFGVRFYWRTRIEEWRPEDYFVDVQLKGPYALWRHTHSFEELAEGRTLMRDRVEYAIPFGPLGRLAHWLLVRRSLKRIFDYRAEMTARLLGSVNSKP
ncbi:MAG TPA: SRPBCC family protein [Blastocatellia bacterium]|nr:SRPBCC family protein [Blastocatellia bacterium]